MIFKDFEKVIKNNIEMIIIIMHYHLFKSYSVHLTYRTILRGHYFWSPGEVRDCSSIILLLSGRAIVPLKCITGRTLTKQSTKTRMQSLPS